MGDQQHGPPPSEVARAKASLGDREAQQHGGQDAELLDLHADILPDCGRLAQEASCSLTIVGRATHCPQGRDRLRQRGRGQAACRGQQQLTDPLRIHAQVPQRAAPAEPPGRRSALRLGRPGPRGPTHSRSPEPARWHPSSVRPSWSRSTSTPPDAGPVQQVDRRIGGAAVHQHIGLGRCAAAAPPAESSAALISGASTERCREKPLAVGTRRPARRATAARPAGSEALSRAVGGASRRPAQRHPPPATGRPHAGRRGRPAPGPRVVVPWSRPASTDRPRRTSADPT